MKYIPNLLTFEGMNTGDYLMEGFCQIIVNLFSKVWAPFKSFAYWERLKGWTWILYWVDPTVNITFSIEFRQKQIKHKLKQTIQTILINSSPLRKIHHSNIVSSLFAKLQAMKLRENPVSCFLLLGIKLMRLNRVLEK